MKVTKRQLRKIIREEKSRILREQAESGLPSVDDLAKKLGAAGPEAALDFISRLLQKANFSAPAELPPEEPAPPPTPSMPDEEV